ncbi:MAG: DoxX family membrane protein, partial [Proteobacteria bacterium]|nr:DoxX family membrane protein [Pseudomonadota bacterium]
MQPTDAVRPAPWRDGAAFLTQPGWTTIAFWLLLAASVLAAVLAFARDPAQRSPRAAGIWLLRVLIGAMWWQQSLWKIPPDFDGLKYWMQQMVEHASVPLQSAFVAGIVLPNISVFGPLVYAVEVAIAVSLMLGLFSRLGAL